MSLGTGKRIGYVRVSTTDQNPERQLENISLDKKFTDYASGTTVSRPQLAAMFEYVRDDDIIIVHSMDRLARNVKDLRTIIDQLIEKSVSIHFIKENLTFNGDDSPMSKLLLMMMGAFAEFEHSIIRERQLEGIAIAKKAGKYKGRARCLNREKIELLKEEMKTRKTISQIALEFKVARSTIYHYLKEINKENTA